MLHWSPLPTSSPPFTGTSSERLSWAWPSPRLVKLEVLTLELLFLLVAPLTPRRDLLGPGQDRLTPVQMWRLEGWLQVPRRKGEACDSPGPTIPASLPTSATSRGSDRALRLGWTHTSVEG